MSALDALATAQDRRMRMAQLRRDLRCNPQLLAEWMADPPELLLDVPLLDLVRWTRSSRARSYTAITDLNGRAVRERVNLMMPLGRASTASREFVAEHGTRYARRRRRDAA